MDVRLSVTGLLIEDAGAGWSGVTVVGDVAGAVDGLTVEAWFGRFVSLRGGTLMDGAPVVPGIGVAGPRSAEAGCWFWRWMRLWDVGVCGASAADRVDPMHKQATVTAAPGRASSER
jgi:hypothetical protein